MPLIQKIDEKKFIQKPAYSYIGSGLSKTNCHRTHPLFLQSGEGFTDIINSVSNLIPKAASLIPKAASLISENKDTLGSVVNSVGSVANAAKAISDTIKTSKELEKIKTIHMKNGERLRSKKKKNKDIELTPEQIAFMEKLGSANSESIGQGFVSVK